MKQRRRENIEEWEKREKKGMEMKKNGFTTHIYLSNRVGSPGSNPG